MAEKWKLGDLEFDTEKEYQEAAQDLKKIKVLMDRFDTAKPDGARKALEQIKGKHGFVSSYGMKFVEKLEKTAGVGSASQATKKTPAAAGKKQQKKTGKTKEEKRKGKACAYHHQKKSDDRCSCDRRFDPGKDFYA